MQDRAEIIFDEGITAYEQEDFETAEAKFIEALGYDPLSEEIKYNLALVYLEMKKYDRCNKLIAQIRELDCGEIIDELEKVDTEEHYSIPESIPDVCAKCFYFTQDSIINEEAGFCSFYHVDVKLNARCYAFQLAEEGKVSLEDITANLHKRSKENALLIMQQLDDTLLPQTINCDYCGAEITLNESERQNGKFECTACRTQFDIKEAVSRLEKEFTQKEDGELFEILIEAQDFRTEYLYAARKEIKKRAIDLKNNEEFLSMLNG
jgi:tetratricopeptide (TPR) repeat protein